MSSSSSSSTLSWPLSVPTDNVLRRTGVSDELVTCRQTTDDTQYGLDYQLTHRVSHGVDVARGPEVRAHFLPLFFSFFSSSRAPVHATCEQCKAVLIVVSSLNCLLHRKDKPTLHGVVVVSEVSVVVSCSQRFFTCCTLGPPSVVTCYGWGRTFCPSARALCLSLHDRWAVD